MPLSLFSPSWASTRGASHDRRRLVRARHWTARPARRERHDAYAGGHGRIELSRFLTPPPVTDHRNAPVNALGYLRVMFAVDDLDDTLARLCEHGAQLVDEVVQYEDVYRLCYVRGPEGILIGLAEQVG
jgi:catechol 2,3-dioxygenase-like lactoylglutathione lyase family enzyme